MPLVLIQVPPKIPSAIWSDIKTISSAEVYKQSSCFKSQENLYLELKPMLSMLDSLALKFEEPKLMIESIQLVSSANLQVSRLRRASTGPYIKRELKKPMVAILSVAWWSIRGEIWKECRGHLQKVKRLLELLFNTNARKVSAALALL